MDNLIIKATSKTPEVEFYINGKIKIKGRSIPEDASIFFDLLQSWVIQYCLRPHNDTIIDVDLEYMNSASAKSLLQLLSELTELSQKGKNLTINWYFESGDDDMIERGEYFEKILKFKFNYIETSN